MTQGLRRRQGLACALLGVVSLGTLVAAAPVWAAAPTRPAPLAYERGRLTGRLDGVPFEQALAAMAQVLPVRMMVKESVGSEPVSVTLDEVGIESALRQILRGHSYLVVHGEDAANPGVLRIVEIVVLGERGARGENTRRGAALVPAEASPEVPIRRSPPRDESELRHLARWGASAAERRGALTALAQRIHGPDGTALLAAALEDPDEAVRAVALRHLAARADAPPLAALARVAREDTSPDLRRRALDLLALGASPESEAELRRALSDPDAGVRRRAEALLRDEGPRGEKVR